MRRKKQNPYGYIEVFFLIPTESDDELGSRWEILTELKLNANICAKECENFLICRTSVQIIGYVLIILI